MWYHVPKVLTIKWKHSLTLLICDRTETFSKVDNYCQSYLHKRNLLYCKTASKINLKEISFRKFSVSKFFSLVYEDVKLAWFIFLYKFTGSRHYRRGLFESSTTSCFASVSPGECTGIPNRQCHRETCIVDTKSCTDLGNLYVTVD